MKKFSERNAQKKRAACAHSAHVEAAATETLKKWGISEHFVENTRLPQHLLLHPFSVGVHLKLLRSHSQTFPFPGGLFHKEPENNTFVSGDEEEM